MLTNKGKYGLKAMAYLASLRPGYPALVGDIAAAETIPTGYLRLILTELKTAGLVHSRKGPGGGFVLAKPASDTKVGDIIRALGGPLTAIACASPIYSRCCPDCLSEKECRVRALMLEVREAVASVLDQQSLADIGPTGKKAA
jgi:Rrf2 family protein